MLKIKIPLIATLMKIYIHSFKNFISEGKIFNTTSSKFVMESWLAGNPEKFRTLPRTELTQKTR